MRWIKITCGKIDSYVDIHQAFRIAILPHDSLFKVRAQFRTPTEIMVEGKNKLTSVYEDIGIFESRKEAVTFIKDILKPFLTGVDSK